MLFYWNVRGTTQQKHGRCFTWMDFLFEAMLFSCRLSIIENLCAWYVYLCWCVSKVLWSFCANEDLSLFDMIFSLFLILSFFLSLSVYLSPCLFRFHAIFTTFVFYSFQRQICCTFFVSFLKILIILDAHYSTK